MAEVSIIIPVYNAEKTIGRCIESVLNQEYSDFELILCNDGSKDNSGKICDEYAGKDSRIKVLHKENSGVSDTRNQGIQMAKGVYIQFMDADDWITVDATKLLVRTMEEHEADLVVSDFYRVVGEHISHKGDIEEEGTMTREIFAKYMMENPADFYYGVLWNKLFKRSIIAEYGLKMDETMSWCEDFLFNLEYLLHAKRIAALQVPVYYYVKTEGSLATQGMNIGKTIKMKISVFEYYNSFYKHVYEEEDYEKRRLGVYRFLIDAASDGFVIPNVLAGTKKLGEERIRSYADESLPDNLFTSHYMRRKLLEQYLEAVALKYDLELADIILLANIPYENTTVTRKHLADYTGFSIRKVSGSLQKLVRKKIIEISRFKGTMLIKLTKEFQSLENEMRHVAGDYKTTCCQGFSDEEKEIYWKLAKKSDENIRRILVKK